MESEFTNRILASLGAAELALLRPLLEPVDLPVRKLLEARNRRIDSAYFLDSGMASIVVTGGSQHTVEVGMVGFEGMTGLALLMGVQQTPHETFIQSAGAGWRIGAAELTRAMEDSPALRNELLRRGHVLQMQMSFTALANARYRMDERLARWLLMAQDRAGGPTVSLTHEFLSLMLGVRRPGVTTAINQFETRGLISATRGVINILDRPALEEAANGCYGAPEAEYERLFGAA